MAFAMDERAWGGICADHGLVGERLSTLIWKRFELHCRTARGTSVSVQPAAVGPRCRSLSGLLGSRPAFNWPLCALERLGSDGAVTGGCRTAIMTWPEFR